eukprot:COSAG01_NODE_51826_length_351_cov_1.563492_1_plen_28_part_10
MNVERFGTMEARLKGSRMKALAEVTHFL